MPYLAHLVLCAGSGLATNVCRKITGQLTNAIAQQEDVAVQLEALDILSDMLSRCGWSPRTRRTLAGGGAKGTGKDLNPQSQHLLRTRPYARGSVIVPAALQRRTFCHNFIGCER